MFVKIRVQIKLLVSTSYFSWRVQSFSNIVRNDCHEKPTINFEKWLIVVLQKQYVVLFTRNTYDSVTTAYHAFTGERINAIKYFENVTHEIDCQNRNHSEKKSPTLGNTTNGTVRWVNGRESQPAAVSVGVSVDKWLLRVLEWRRFEWSCDVLK